MGVYQELEKIALINGVKLTENAVKIANYRERANIPLHICPCHPKDRFRGCQFKIGGFMKKKCYNEIIRKGVCCCNCYKRG